MEHNSNLFGDASFLAVPAIHFFGFPGYYTSNPPRLPSYLFESPERRQRLREQMREQAPLTQQWLCGCLGKSDPHHLDVPFCRQERADHKIEDITIRFGDGPTDSTTAGRSDDSASDHSGDDIRGDPQGTPRRMSPREQAQVPLPPEPK